MIYKLMFFIGPLLFGYYVEYFKFTTVRPVDCLIGLADAPTHSEFEAYEDRLKPGIAS